MRIVLEELGLTGHIPYAFDKRIREGVLVVLMELMVAIFFMV